MSGKSKVCALPGCGNAGSAEDKLKVCGGCGDVAYCTVEHQREHWATHKGQCKQKHKKSTDPIESHLRRGGQDRDVAVTWDDQKRINRFGQLNARLQDLLDELKESESEVQNLEDAISEIEVLLEDDACRVRVGDVFITMSNDAAQARAESDLASAKQRLAGQRMEHSAIQTEMSALKSTLGAKFGDAINLETDEEKEARKQKSGK